MFNSKKWSRKTSSKYKGVCFDNAKRYPKRPWLSSIYHKKTIFIGHFSTEEEAAKAYDKAAYKIAGEFAKLNFPSLRRRAVV